MYENIRFSVIDSIQRERKKVNKTNKVSEIRNDLKEHDDKSSFKDKYEEVKRERKLIKEEDIIVDSSLSQKLEENKKLERLIEDRLAHNPLLSEVLNKNIITPLKDEEEIKNEDSDYNEFIEGKAIDEKV